MIRILPYYKRAFSIFWKEPGFRAIASAALTVLLAGTVFYRFAEGWSWLDAMYFSTITLASVGYGDFTPTTSLTRLFTIFYVFFGLSIVGAFLNLLVRAPMIVNNDASQISRDTLAQANRLAVAKTGERRGRTRRFRQRYRRARDG